MVYGVVSNEVHTVVNTIEKLKLLEKMTTYVSWKAFQFESDAWEWVNKTSRVWINKSIKEYNRDVIIPKESRINYVGLNYVIGTDAIYYNIDTSRIGFIKFYDKNKYFKQSASYGQIKLQRKTSGMDNSLISCHCRAIMDLISQFPIWLGWIVTVPDYSVYLGLEREINKAGDSRMYKGKILITINNKEMV